MDNRYLRIMGEYSPMLQNAAVKVLEETGGGADVADTVAACVAAPSLYGFIRWVLEQARREGIHDLYFLARDGDILCKIAQVICQRLGWNFRLHYLYCSRMALRKAAYSLPQVNFEAYIFEGGYRVTPEIIFARAGITEEQEAKLLKALGKGKDYLQYALSKQEQLKLRKQLMGMPVFVKACLDGSGEQLRCCREYLRQEGLLDAGHAGVVDTGWTGSVQWCLSQIMRASGSEYRLLGFYFGLYNDPPQDEFSHYHSWYFNGRSSLAKAARFNNNLLESFCSCSDPMTVGYRQEKDRYVPVFTNKNPVADGWDIERQQRVILNFVKNSMKEAAGKEPSPDKMRELSRRLLEQFMYFPTLEEARIYGGILFCDDMTEKHLVPLAVPRNREEIWRYWFPARLFRTFLMKGKNADTPVYWPAGTLCLSDVKNPEKWKKQFLLWDMLHIWKRRRK